MAKIQFNRERYSCGGRGFGVSNSFFDHFERWIVDDFIASPTPPPSADGGPKWYILDTTYRLVPDGSSDQYIVISNHSDITTNPNAFTDPHKILKIGYNTNTSNKIFIAGYLWWDASSQNGYGNWFYKEINSVDDGEFIYDFRGGNEMLSIAARAQTDWAGIVISDWTPSAKYFDSQDATSVGAVITNNPGAGSPATINFAVGEGAQFLDERWYYIYDMNGVSQVDYVQVTVPGTNSVTVDNLQHSYTAANNPVMCAYGHRFMAYGATPIGGSGRQAVFPYCSYPSNLAAPTRIFNLNGPSYLPSGKINIVLQAAPDDEGNYWAIPPVIQEYQNGGGSPTTSNMNRAYGVPVEHYWSTDINIEPYIGGRNVESEPYMYVINGFSFDMSGDLALLIPDYDYITT